MKKGKLKSIELTRAELLTQEQRHKNNLPEKGLVIVEVREYEED